MLFVRLTLTRVTAGGIKPGKVVLVNPSIIRAIYEEANGSVNLVMATDNMINVMGPLANVVSSINRALNAQPKNLGDI